MRRARVDSPPHAPQEPPRIYPPPPRAPPPIWPGFFELVDSPDLKGYVDFKRLNSLLRQSVHTVTRKSDHSANIAVDLTMIQKPMHGSTMADSPEPAHDRAALLIQKSFRRKNT